MIQCRTAHWFEVDQDKRFSRSWWTFRF